MKKTEWKENKWEEDCVGCPFYQKLTSDDSNKVQLDYCGFYENFIESMIECNVESITVTEK